MADWTLQTVHNDVEEFCRHLRKNKHGRRRYAWLRKIAGILRVSF